jgi:hypothetical protein
MSVPVSGGQLVGLSGLGTPRGLTVECNSVHFSRHAIERMFQRSIPPDEIFECIRSGEVIANYPDDSPYPSALLLGFTHGAPLHVLVARDDKTENCYVVTAYRPDPELWGTDFKTRREP